MSLSSLVVGSVGNRIKPDDLIALVKLDHPQVAVRADDNEFGVEDGVNADNFAVEHNRINLVNRKVNSFGFSFKHSFGFKNLQNP